MCGECIEGVLHQFPHADPYRGRAPSEPLPALPGGISVFGSEARGQRGLIAVCARVAPGPPPPPGLARWRAALAAASDARGRPMHDGEGDREEWLRAGLTRALRLEGLRGMAVLVARGDASEARGAAQGGCGITAALARELTEAAAGRGVAVGCYLEL
ncbi:unnamed protein product [Prorocentrum cordatum]|uniref:Uncharacterized protein n=1 Tax=Prorocentrum cordatum TaxID=2364126 RepID=A0ABN9W611_9DINO|nr:unnamed protein product [Polarella glacialis]